MTVAEFLATFDGKWAPAPKALPGIVETMSAQCGHKLPEDYLHFLGLCNGGNGFLAVQPCYLRLWSAETLIQNNIDYQMPEFVPGFFAFADSGGGEFFAFDIRRKRRLPIVSIPFVPMEVDAATPVANSFADLLSQVVAP